jgi:ribosomal protein S12 methylthiotransferase accessory factor
VKCRSARLIPAQEIWITQALHKEFTFIMSNTNACALGGSLEEATLFALYEAIERDAILLTWYLRRGCQSIDPESVSLRDFRVLWARTKALCSNYRFHFFNVTTDVLVPSILVFAVRQSGKGPKAVSGSASHLDSEIAMLKALGDMAGEVSVKAGRDLSSEVYARLLKQPQSITRPDDHRDLYYMDQMFERLRFLQFEQSDKTSQGLDEVFTNDRKPELNLRIILEELLGSMEELGLHVFVKDITHRGFESAGIHCVKVVVPGLFPMWFGQTKRVFATPRLLRLAARYERGDSTVVINSDVHPFS